MIRGKEGDKMINLQQYWKALFLTSILILIGLLLFPSTAMAKASKQLESLIKQREWDKVSQLVNPGRDAALYHQVYRIRSFLNSRDNCIKHPNQSCYKATAARWKDLVEDPTMKKARFSKEFNAYLNDQKDAFKDAFKAKIKQIGKERIKKQEEGRIKRERIREEARIKEEKEEQERFERERAKEETRIKRERARQEEARIKREKEKARIKREKEKQERIKREEEKAFKIVSNKAAKLGYKKVLKLGIVRFLYKVKQEGGLKEGLNLLLWCRPTSIDASLDKKFKISQVLEDVLIYDYSEFIDDELVQFTIIIPKKQGELYLEGQALLGEYFTYTGNLTYITVLGANKTAPVFKPVEIADAP